MANRECQPLECWHDASAAFLMDVMSIVKWLELSFVTPALEPQCTRTEAAAFGWQQGSGWILPPHLPGDCASLRRW